MKKRIFALAGALMLAGSFGSLLTANDVNAVVRLPGCPDIRPGMQLQSEPPAGCLPYKWCVYVNGTRVCGAPCVGRNYRCQRTYG